MTRLSDTNLEKSYRNNYADVFPAGPLLFGEPVRDRGGDKAVGFDAAVIAAGFDPADQLGNQLPGLAVFAVFFVLHTNQYLSLGPRSNGNIPAGTHWFQFASLCHRHYL